MASQFIPGTRALRIFVAAGKHLNFSKAAEAVSLTPAAVSYQIREMEEQYGFPLFKRNSRSIQLTPEGEKMFLVVSESLEKMALALGEAKTLHRQKEELKLSVGARFATYWLLPRLNDFKQIRPDLTVTLDITDKLRELGRDDIDLAIRFGNGTYTELEAIKLFETSLIPVCSPSFLAVHPELKQPEDLLRVPLSYVNCSVSEEPWPDWEMWMSHAGVKGGGTGLSIAFPDLSHVIQTVQENVAVGLVESALVSRELTQGTMIQLFDTNLTLSEGLAYYLVYPQQTEKRDAITDFMNWLFSIIEV